MDFTDICRRAGIEPFCYDGSYLRSREHSAEQELAGRTHYFDANTRGFFGSRVLLLRAFDGVVLGAVKSVKAGFEGGGRVFRPVFFAVDGEVILDRPRISDSYKTAEAAKREFWRLAGTLDTAAELRSAIQRSAAKHGRARARLLEALDAFEEPVAA